MDADPVGFLFTVRAPVEGRYPFGGLPELRLTGDGRHFAACHLNDLPPAENPLTSGVVVDR